MYIHEELKRRLDRGDVPPSTHSGMDCLASLEAGKPLSDEEWDLAIGQLVALHTMARQSARRARMEALYESTITLDSTMAELRGFIQAAVERALELKRAAEGYVDDLSLSIALRSSDVSSEPHSGRAVLAAPRAHRVVTVSSSRSGSRDDPDDSEPPRPGNRANSVYCEEEISWLLRQQSTKRRADVSVRCGYCGARRRGAAKALLGSEEVHGWWVSHACRPSG